MFSLPNPADTKHNIYVVFMLEGYVKIMLDFMLECLLYLCSTFYVNKTRHSNINSNVILT